MVYELSNWNWFVIWGLSISIIWSVYYLVKTEKEYRRRDLEVVLGINEVMNILSQGMMSDKYKEKTYEVLNDLKELKKLLYEEKS